MCYGDGEPRWKSGPPDLVPVHCQGIVVDADGDAIMDTDGEPMHCSCVGELDESDCGCQCDECAEARAYNKAAWDKFEHEQGRADYAYDTMKDDRYGDH